MKGIRILLDGNNTSFRANSVTELYTKSGVRTSAIMGTLNIAHSVIESLTKRYSLPVNEVIFAWDKGHSKRRTDLYPEYKANRHKEERTEEEKQFMKEFIEQANVLYENLPLFGMKCIRKDGWEGDDLIYCVAKTLQKRYPEDSVVVVSTDEDFHQLVTKNIDVYSPIKEVLYTRSNYKEITEIDPELFLTYKILKGDSSDGIPGIAGIGDKTAKSLVNTYGDMSGLLSSNNREQLLKSKRTAKIFTTEGLETLSRNDKLINLDYVDTAPIQSDVDEVLDEEPFVDNKGCTTFLMKYQLTSILTKWRTWSNTFLKCSENWFN